MANILGTVTLNNTRILEVDAVPSAGAGTASLLGAIAIFDTGATASIYYKFGALDTQWKEINKAGDSSFDNSSNGFVATNVQAAIEEAKAYTSSISRFTIQLLNNSSMTNGQRLTYSELLPNTPIVFPRSCLLKELTFANSTALSDWSFNFYRNSISAPNLLFTWAGTNISSAFRSDRNDAFAAGDQIIVVFTDTGDNPSDAAMVLFLQTT